MNIIQTNHRPIAYDFVPLLLLLVLLCCCYCCYLLSTAAVTIVATCYCCYYYRLLCCYLLLLLLATVVTTDVPCHCCYSLHCCYLLQLWFARRWQKKTISVNGQLLAPFIRPLEIVCRVNRSFLTPLLSSCFAADTLLADSNLSGVVESDTFTC